MAVKKTKKSAKKPTGKTRKGMKKGAQLVCAECGLVVMVEEVCPCGDACDLVCCGEPMLIRC